MEKSNAPISVDAYLNALPEKQKSALEHLRQIIKGTAPKAEEVISYGMPAYKYYGQLCYFAAFDKHCSLFAVNKTAFLAELKDYKISKGTIQFTLDKPLPDDLVKRIIESRMKENEAKYALQKTKKKAPVIKQTA